MAHGRGGMVAGGAVGSRVRIVAPTAAILRERAAPMMEPAAVALITAESSPVGEIEESKA